MYKLNENQNFAARHLNGPMMVLAGPGSGKTAVIAARAGILSGLPDIAEKFNWCRNSNNKGVLVITYSKAAANEMERRYNSIRQETNKTSNSAVTFGTFHSVFFRILRRKKNLSTEQILAEGERRAVITGFLTEMQYEPDDEMLANVLSEMSLFRNELHEPNLYHSKTMGTEDFTSVCRQYEAYKAEKNKIDFDDMLCGAYEVLKNHPNELDFWRKKYPFIMIDEFQDINRVQYETVKLLAAPANNLFIVGDDDQSIYRFRGSRPEFLLNFPEDFPQAQRVTLETNYRSTDAIISYANNLIIHNKLRYNKNISGTGRAGAPPTLLVAEDRNSEAVQIAERIRKEIARGANPDEIAVAFRLNIQSRAFTDIFSNMNIPYRCRDEMPSVYQHWIALDLFAYLRTARRLGLRQKTGFDPDALRIINKPYRFVSKAFLKSVKKQDKDIFLAYKRDPLLHIATKNSIEELRDDMLAVSRLSTSEAMRYIRKNMGYNRHITETCEYRKINPAGLFEIADELQDAAKQFKNPLDFIKHAEKVAAEVADATKNKSGPCVTLTTLHSAKGLEFELVFIAGVVEEILPYIRSKTAAEIEEERRLFYVGVTRAKHELFLSATKTGYDKPTKPSRFLNCVKNGGMIK
ncbi:MAG: ATP-dependent helicase [Defluviitaleaceae bacterium]|nr:ATP-dependent helicase [Defluviitaleaceae bacterium]